VTRVTQSEPRRGESQHRLAPELEPAPALCQEWYLAYGQGIYGYLRWQLASADEAEDLTAEVFLRALRAVHRFDPRRGSAQAWLYRIARNALRDQQRQARRRRQVPLGALRDLQCQAPSPEERILREEEVARLLASVDLLGPADRELIGLRYGSALSITEVGEVLGVREPAVRTRLWRALSRLRKALAP
jgi:RNA polymerase sigma-70 factor (ECF subfamily)